MRILRTDSDDPDFKTLVRDLDAYLAHMDGDEHIFYAALNKTDHLATVVVVYEDLLPVACGAIREYDAQATEVKRMYTIPDYRGKGYAIAVLNELERWAKELSYLKCVLETGRRQPEAIRLYERSGYVRVPNYGQYDGVENSVCFAKTLLQAG